jgi:hypothetical protein
MIKFVDIIGEKELHEQLKKEVVDLFKSLLLFSNEDVEKRLAKIEQLPDEGLIKLLKTFRIGHEKQDECFKVLMDRDYMFASNIITALY